ncbi:hypothetical protein FQN57_006118 [Myotisia sp. PD_48]|nr:hypothetical protein FQN57_006118 [Myotisia sp. PD_48]
MTVRNTPFTPEALLAAPRRSPCFPNPAGTLIAYTESTYSFESRSTHTELLVLDVASKQTKTVSTSYRGNPRWLDNEQLIWLMGERNGNTKFMIGNVSAGTEPYVAGIAPGPVSDLKITSLGTTWFGFAVSGKANLDGTLHNPSNSESPVSSGKIYTSLFVRHWDEYIQDEKNTIWIGTISLPIVQHNITTTPPYKVSELTNLFSLFDLQGVESPIPPFGGTDHFDLSSQGIVFVSKDPSLNPATHTKCVCYACPIRHWRPAEIHELQATPVEMGSLKGALSSPVISPDGNTLALLAMKEDGYESDKNRIIIVDGIFGPRSNATEVFAGENGVGGWDRSPNTLTWAHDGSALIIQVEHTGRGAVYQLPISTARNATPDQLTKLSSSGYVSSVASTPKGLFLSSSSLLNSSVYSILSSSLGLKTISSASENRASFGLSPAQVDEIWWKGADNHPVHAWVLKPSTFKPTEKYPLAFLVHGGPQGAWNDQWSTRWNPAIFAEQGYVVVTPNPTGSTGYGQPFTDAIQGSWGGKPYEDLVKCFEYIESNLHYVDTDRAVALGASYGGFMMNWIQGHDLGRKFKALVTHDGIFSTKFALATEELYFPIHDLQGTYWESKKMWQKWDPSEFIPAWQTPHLIIHNSLDYRLSIAEGLAAFNALQMRGVESAFLTFPDENHWVIKPENSLVWHRTVINWINKYVGLPLILDKDGTDGFPTDSSAKHITRMPTRNLAQN